MNDRDFETLVKRCELESNLRKLMYDAFMEGYDLGYGVEELEDMDRKLVNSRFERWYDVNHDY